LASVVHDDAVSDAPQLTAEEARAALEEAGMRAAQVHRNDRQLGWMLLVVLAVFLGAGAVISLSPHHGSTYAGVAVVVMLVAAIVAAVVIGLRIRAYSKGGIIWYFSAIIAFNLWNAAVTSVSILTRFWASDQPSYHFGISVAVGVIPLLIGGMVLGRRR
jgi:hypothetical protein